MRIWENADKEWVKRDNGDFIRPGEKLIHICAYNLKCTQIIINYSIGKFVNDDKLNYYQLI